MKNSLLLALALLVTVTLGFAAEKKTAPKKKPAPNPALAKIEDVPGLPRVLLIGDSISIGYTLPVRELLKGKANVHRIPMNGGHTKTGLENIDQWLGSSKWDVIHFNWGLHDLKYLAADNKTLADPKAPTSRQQVPPAEYEKNLTALVAKLKATGAKLIWRNTTPVPEGSQGRLPADAPKYNEIAARVMKEAGVMTEDLFSHSLKAPAGYQLPANVHYSPEGSKYLAEHVVAAIQSQLPKQ
jgi:acyl-CoA thioesterase-1